MQKQEWNLVHCAKLPPQCRLCPNLVRNMKDPEAPSRPKWVIINDQAFKHLLKPKIILELLLHFFTTFSRPIRSHRLWWEIIPTLEASLKVFDSWIPSFGTSNLQFYTQAIWESLLVSVTSSEITITVTIDTHVWRCRWRIQNLAGYRD